MNLLLCWVLFERYSYNYFDFSDSEHGYDSLAKSHQSPVLMNDDMAKEVSDDALAALASAAVDHQQKESELMNIDNATEPTVKEEKVNFSLGHFMIGHFK